jgi:riboflavin-specific deaminase-like protein
MKSKRGLPFVYINVAMTADGKIAPANRHFEPFGSARDRRHLLELRATADAVMSGARTVDLDHVNLGPGPATYRRQRVSAGLAEYNLRVIVSGAGSIDPHAEVFKHHFSPIIILTTGLISKAHLSKLRSLADEVKICGKRELDFEAAFCWLREKWQVERLLCEGGGQLNGALFKASLVDEIHLTLCPVLMGGRIAPTLSDGEGVEHLPDAARFQLASKKRIGDELFLVYRRRTSKESSAKI